MENAAYQRILKIISCPPPQKPEELFAFLGPGLRNWIAAPAPRQPASVADVSHVANCALQTLDICAQRGS
jgi:hypothetical protein